MTVTLPAASFGDLRRAIARAGEDHGLFELGQAIDFETDETAVVARAKRDGRRPEAGARVRRDRVVSVWEGLPTSLGIGAVLDEAQFVHRVARDLRLAAGLGVLDDDRAAIAVGFGDVSMLGIPAEYGNGMTLPFAIGGNRHVHLEPSDAWPLRALAVGADDIAREVVARLILRLQAKR